MHVHFHPVSKNAETWRGSLIQAVPPLPLLPTLHQQAMVGGGLQFAINS